MSRLGIYMLRQMAVPMAFGLIGMTAIVWLSQSLDMIDLVVNRGQSAWVFAQLSVLILPLLLTNILPIAVFVATLYGLHRLREDSELTVMSASGISRWGLMWPVMVFGGAAMLAAFALNLYFMPAGYRTMKDMVYEIREDLAGVLLREGEFLNPADGVTVFIGSAPPGGDLLDLMVHNARDPDQPLTYLARRGAFVSTDEGPRLVMENGTILHRDVSTENVTLLQFDSYVFDLSQFVEPRGPHSRDLSERYLHELLNPDLTRAWDRRNIDRLYAEAHDRLSSPLYNLALALIPFVAVACGVYNRRGYARRLGAAMAAAVAVRLSGFGMQAMVATTPALVPILYIIPVGSIVICLLMIGGVVPNVFARVPGNPDDYSAEGA
jgi:lipopolysaccharide export system permease protein